MNAPNSFIHARDWIRAAWPFTLVAGGGALWFGGDIVHSIQSTPHPALVYIILGALVAAVAMALIVLRQLTAEERRARQWIGIDPEDVADRHAETSSESPFQDAYALVVQQAAQPKEVNRQELERRLAAAENAYAERLSFPGFVAGALVGLGLVGTFIGLLGALEDLAKLFSGMSMAAGGDPAALFSGLLLKLQAPMKSMGTAFIASLYGLLGSLVLGLTLVAVNATRMRVNATVHDTLFDAFGSIPVPHASQSVSQGQLATPVRWDALIDALTGLRMQMADDAEDSRQPLRRVEAALNALSQKLDDQSAAMAGLRHPQLWLDAWSQMNDQLSQLRAQEAATSNAMRQALHDQTQISEQQVSLTSQVHALIARTSERSRQHDMDTIAALQGCQQVFEDVSGRLRSVLSLQTDMSVDAQTAARTSSETATSLRDATPAV
ncbi:MAG: hypothetical protein ABW220_15945 [Burkholderiaceae bacterium]